MNCSGDFSRVVPPENMDDGALIDGVVRINDLGAREAEEGIDGNKNDTDGIIVNGASPLKIMICSKGEGRMNKSFPKGREGAIIRLVDQGEIGMADLETSQESVIPSGEVYIRVGNE